MLIPCKVCSTLDSIPDPIPASKYKCPKCIIPYCSVACYKLHKCLKPLVSNPDHQLSLDQLSLIFKTHSSDINPDLLKILKEIDESQTSNEAVEKLHKYRTSSNYFNEWCTKVLKTAKEDASISSVDVPIVLDNTVDDDQEGMSNSLYIIK